MALQSHSPPSLPTVQPNNPSLSSSLQVDASNPASSLRAAALSTLKSKRRKPAVAKPLPPPRAPAESVQLDYGDEASSSDIIVVDAVQPSKPPRPSQNQDKPEEVEEGEISDLEEYSKPVPVAANTGANQASLKGEVKKEPVSPSVGGRKPSIPPPFISDPYRTIDANHIRPGLRLTPVQFDNAKDIILDLLGWGVPPEYLVNYGVSRELVYYAFKELNLRLPANLNIDSLPDYPFPQNIVDAITKLRNDISSATRDSSTIGIAQIRRHPSLPPKPTISELSTSTSTSRAPLGNAPSEANPVTPTLHDMEQQRRQELVARKSVQRSRKARNSTASSSSVPVSPKTNEPRASSPKFSGTPTTVVDEFLNSIGPLTKTIATSSPEPMDVASVSDMVVVTAPSSINKTLSVENSSMPSSPSSWTPTTPVFINVDSERRGVKRPVAADFVNDLDAATVGDNGNRNGYAQWNGSSSVSFRRKRTSFANLGGVRRCVIDLSDSEDEEENPSSDVPTVSSGATGWHATRRTLTSTTNAAASHNHSNGSVTPSSGAMTPAMLVEKETEIKRMREMIAKRELDRLKKMAALSRSNSTSSTTHRSSPAASEVPITTEREKAVSEDVDMDEVLSSGNPSAGTSAEGSNVSTPAYNDINNSANDSNSQSTADEKEAVPDLIDEVGPLRKNSIAPVLSPEMSTMSKVDQNFTSYVSPLAGYSFTRSSLSSSNVSSQAPFSGTSSSTSSFLPIESYSSIIPTSLSSLSHRTPTTAQGRLSHQVVSQPRAAFEVPHIDLKGLKLRRVDASKRICQYEIPGGGVCRDATCEDVHLSRLEEDAEGRLTAAEIAEYVFERLPMEWRITHPRVDVGSITDALAADGVHATGNKDRHDKHNIGLEDRITRALTTA